MLGEDNKLAGPSNLTPTSHSWQLLTLIYYSNTSVVPPKLAPGAGGGWKSSQNLLDALTEQFPDHIFC